MCYNFRSYLYIPNAEAAVASMAHADSVVIDLKGLTEVKDSDESGHFSVNPRKVRRLNSQKRMAALRIFGPDEENFGLNMEMFAEAEISPNVFTLLPSYVQAVSKQKGSKYVARASRLGNFNYYSSFGAGDRGVGGHFSLRGVRRRVAAGDAPEITPVRCYETLLADPNAALRALDKKTASGLLELVSHFYAKQDQ